MDFSGDLKVFKSVLHAKDMILYFSRIVCIVALWVGEINIAEGLTVFFSGLTNVSLTEKLKIG